MEDLSLHLLDIMENCLNAQATRIEVRIDENPQADLLTLQIKDNGRGMDAQTLENSTNPFFTTRKTRRYGLGLSMLSESARATGGKLEVDSTPGKGTLVKATFHPSHIDMRPMGDIPQTLVTLIMGNPGIELYYNHSIAGESISLDTAELKESLTSPKALRLVEERLREGLAELARRARGRELT